VTLPFFAEENKSGEQSENQERNQSEAATNQRRKEEVSADELPAVQSEAATNQAPNVPKSEGTDEGKEEEEFSADKLFSAVYDEYCKVAIDARPKFWVKLECCALKNELPDAKWLKDAVETKAKLEAELAELRQVHEDHELWKYTLFQDFKKYPDKAAQQSQPANAYEKALEKFFPSLSKTVSYYDFVTPITEHLPALRTAKVQDIDDLTDEIVKQISDDRNKAKAIADYQKDDFTELYIDAFRGQFEEKFDEAIREIDHEAFILRLFKGVSSKLIDETNKNLLKECVKLIILL